MWRLFGCQPSDVPVIELAVACSYDQINSVRLLCSEGEVKRVVPLIVTFEHLLFKQILVLLIGVLSTAKLDLGAIRDELGEALLLFRDALACLYDKGVKK